MPKYDPKYEWNGGWLTHTYVQSTGDALRFQARDIRHERTGIHARVQVTWNGIGMGSDVFNVERDAARTHLINAAKKRLAQRDIKPELAAADLEHGFDLFCEGLWREQVSMKKAQRLEGDPDIEVVQLVRGLVVEGGGTVIYCPPGRGKTYTLLTLAVCLDAGLPIPGLFEVLRPEPVLFINLERSASSMRYRLGRVNKA